MKSRSWIIDLAGLVTIVGTIIGASWVSQSITNARIDGLEKSLNASIDGLEKSTNTRIDGLEKRMGVMEGSLEDLRDDIRELWAALYRVITNQVAQLGSGLEDGDTVFAPPPERSEE